MPTAAPRPCRHPGCKLLVLGSDRRCTKHQRELQARIDAQRGSATSRGYDSRWRAARAAFLRAHPLCRACEAQGKTVPATVVDHIVAHKGDRARFWDSGNWQPLCKSCHDRKTAREDGRWGA